MPPKKPSGMPSAKRAKVAASHSRPSPSSFSSSEDNSHPKSLEMVVEQLVSLNAINGLGIQEILTEMNWQNILTWGGEACIPLVKSMYSSIRGINFEHLSSNISYRSQTHPFHPSAIFGIINDPYSDEGDNRFDPTLIEAERYT